MKRFISVLLTLVLTLGVFSGLDIKAEAYNEIDGLRFYINERTDYESYGINCYEVNTDSVVIPSEYDSVPVTMIESFSCYWTETNFSVCIPESINHIENRAFGDCKTITEFIVSEENEHYKSVDGVLYSKDGTVLIRYPQIRDEESFTVPEGVEVIADYAFTYCTNLKNIYLADSVKSIGYWAFGETAYYENYRSSTASTLYNNGHLIEAKSSLRGSYTVEDGTKNVATCAFASNDYLTSVSLPDSVVSIQENAFAGCDKLSEISLSNGLKTIGDGAFSGCDSLTSIEFPESLELIDRNAFLECMALESVDFSKAEVVIGEQAFWRCSSLLTLEIPETVISVGDSAFADCESLGAISIAGGVGKIGNHSFNNTAYLNNSENWENGALYIDNILISVKEEYSGEFCIKDGTKQIASYAFNRCDDIESIVIPESVVKIGDYAFWCCEKLNSVNLPSELSVLCKGVFSHCVKLPYVEIPESVTIIEDEAFWNCNALSDLVIPENVEYIGWSAFVSCSSLQEIYLSENVQYIGEEAFSGCKRLENFFVDENNPCYTSVDGVLFDKTVETLLQYPGRCEGIYRWYETSYEIPGTVTKIGNYAFGYCYELDNVVIPESVIEIGCFAFVCCRSFKALKIPDSVIRIGWRAFDNCLGLKDISLSKNISYVSYGMLENCDSLETVELPSNIKAILPSAFYYCDNLKSIVIPYGVTQIDYRLFYQCPSLESITIPKTVKSICQFAFYNCENLKFVFYGGSQADWDSIEIMRDGNQWLLDAKFHFGTDGHTSSGWITDKKATVNAKGKKHKECTVCGAVLQSATIAQLKCLKPTLKTIENTADGVKITWGSVSGADKYYVYRKTSSGKYSKIGTATKTGYTDKTAKSGTKYYYYVKAVNEAGSSEASGSKSIYHLADTTLSTPKSTKSGVKLSWKKVTGAEGYVVYRKTGSGSYSKLATVKGNSKVTYTDASAKKGKKYTYKIKAYKSKTYSAYSNAKAVTDKY